MDKKKMKLKLNSLKVKSFVTGDQADKVKAGVGVSENTNCFISCFEPCGTGTIQTQDATCPNTCGNSCGGTCLASCNNNFTCDSCYPCTGPDCIPSMPPACPSEIGQFICQ